MDNLQPRNFRALLMPLYFGVLAMQPIWHAWLAPPRKSSMLFALALFALPLLPAALCYLLRSRLANVVAAMTLLPYFVLASMQAADIYHRVPALMQSALIVVFYLLWLMAVLGEKRAAKTLKP
jgi:uncharacterized membrane protein